jgi:hypothetical protein
VTRAGIHTGRGAAARARSRASHGQSLASRRCGRIARSMAPVAPAATPAGVTAEQLRDRAQLREGQGISAAHSPLPTAMRPGYLAPAGVGSRRRHPAHRVMLLSARRRKNTGIQSRSSVQVIARSGSMVHHAWASWNPAGNPTGKPSHGNPARKPETEQRHAATHPHESCRGHRQAPREVISLVKHSWQSFRDATRDATLMSAFAYTNRESGTQP